MSVASDTPRVIYTPATGDFFYDIPFQYDDEAEISVWLNYNELLLGVDYTLSGVGLEDEGTVAGNGRAVQIVSVDAQAALALEQVDGLCIVRFTHQYRDTAFIDGTPYYAATIEEQFDLLSLQVQDIQRDLNRTVRVENRYRPTGHVMDFLPNFIGRAGQICVVNEEETAITLASPDEVQNTDFVICPEDHGTKDRIARWNGDVECQLEDSNVAIDGDGNMSRLQEMRGNNEIVDGLEAWTVRNPETDPGYTEGDEYQLSGFGWRCILTNDGNILTAPVAVDGPTYWEPRGAPIEFHDLVAFFNNIGMELGDIDDVGRLRFKPKLTSNHHRVDVAMSNDHVDNYKILWPLTVPSDVDDVLAVDSIDGTTLTLGWQTPSGGGGGGDVGLGDPYQCLITDAAGTGYAWVDRPYDPICFRSGRATAGEVVFYTRPVRPFRVPANCVGSHVSALNGATAESVYTLWRFDGFAWSIVGTFTFAAGGGGAMENATLATTGGLAVVIGAGEGLKITAPASSDATLADVQVSLLVQLQTV